MSKKTAFEVKNISFYYGRNRALDDLSLAIEQGRFYGVVGPNGCGKTTLLDILVRNKTPGSGTIKFLGMDMGGYTRRRLAKEISLVPQDFYINFAFTPHEIVLMGRHPYIPRFSSPSSRDLELVAEIMEKMEIDGFNDRHITELSGGERQRVIFARALAQDTPVLILDEGTSSMDIRHTLTTLDMVAHDVKKRGKTVISTFHDLNMAAAYCDRLIFMRSGRVVSEGDTDEVLNEENIRDIFEVDSKIYFDRYSNSKQVIFRKVGAGEGKDA